MAEPSNTRYWAFISYSHQDSRVATAVHRAIERYRVPRRLVGRETETGEIPRRLFPVFRDRDELPSSAELGGFLHRTLGISRFLIVICSPQAAASRWVNEEIRLFREMGRGHRILAVIVDGEPNAADPARECFPAALRESRDGARVEPIAADLRHGGDGWFRVRMKLLSGLLGVGLDELLQRERRRQWQLRLAWSAGSLAVLSVALGALGMQQRRYEQREHAQWLERLVENGRRELLAEAPMRAAVYLSAAYANGVDTPALRFMLRQAMQPIDALEAIIPGAGRIWSMVSSADGRRLAVLDGDGRIRVWSLADRARVAEFEVPDPGRQDSHCAPNLSADGRLLAFISVETQQAGGHLSVWSVETGRRLLQVPVEAYTCPSSPFAASGESVIGVAPGGRVGEWALTDGRFRDLGIDGASVAGYSGDGRWLVVGRRNGEVILASPDDPAAPRRLQGLQGAVAQIEFDGDDRRLLAASVTGEVRAWTLPEAIPAFVGGHQRLIRKIEFAGDSGQFLTASEDGTRVWRSQDGRLLYSGQAHPDNQGRALSLRRSGMQFAQVAEHSVQVVDVQSGKPLFAYESEAQATLFTRDGQHLLIGDVNGQIAEWGASFRPQGQGQHGRRVASAPLHWRNLVDFVALADGRLLSGGQDGVLRWWAPDTLDSAGEFAVLRSAITRLARTPDGKRVAAATVDGEIGLWEVASGRLLQRLSQAGSSWSGLLLSHDAQHLFAVDRSNAGRLWTIGEAAPPAEYRLDSRFALDLSPDGRRLALAVDRHVQVIDLATRRLLLDAPLAGGAEAPPIGCLQFSPDGQALVAMARDRSGLVNWIPLVGGERKAVRVGDATNCYGARFDPQGQRVALLAAGRFGVPVWTPSTGRLQDFIGHTALVFDAAFSADSRFLATAGSDGVVKFWDSESGLALRNIGLHAGAALRVGFSADGGTLYSAGADDGRLLAWSLGSETRTAGEVAGRVDCISPWSLDGANLQRRAVDLAQCLPPVPAVQAERR